MAYPGTDVVLICFSIDSPTSYFNAKALWYEEVKKHAVGAKIMLVGTKKDLREDPAAIARLAKDGEVIVKRKLSIR